MHQEYQHYLFYHRIIYSKNIIIQACFEQHKIKQVFHNYLLLFLSDIQKSIYQNYNLKNIFQITELICGIYLNTFQSE